MRRLVLAAVAVAATAGGLPAASAYDCFGTVQPIGVTAAGHEAGVCVGITCARICYLVHDPYCAAPAGSPAAPVCALVDPLEV